MMTVQEIMAELQLHGSESIRKILLKHGVKEPFFGVKIEYLKPIQKKIKMDYQLAKDPYATGNADAMYLAGLIADDKQMSRMNGIHGSTSLQKEFFIILEAFTTPHKYLGEGPTRILDGF